MYMCLYRYKTFVVRTLVVSNCVMLYQNTVNKSNRKNLFCPNLHRKNKNSIMSIQRIYFSLIFFPMSNDSHLVSFLIDGVYSFV